MTRPGRPSKVEKTDLVTAAARVFAEQGYFQSRLEDVAQILGITKGAIYYHYPSKEGLLREVYIELLGTAFSRATNAVAGVTSPEARLRALVHVHICVSRELPDHAATWLQWASYKAAHQLRNGEEWSEVQSLRARYEALWVKAIGEFATVGEPNAQLLANLSLGALNWMYVWFHPQSAEDLEVSEMAADFTIRGLANWSTVAAAPIE